MDLLSLVDASLLLQQEPFVESSSDVTSSSSNQSSSSCPPPHGDSPPPLDDRVGGGGGNPIGPKKRSRRGPAPRTPQQQARSVARRNARERKRVRLVNLGFATLRDHIPPSFGAASSAKSENAKSKLPKPSSSSSKKLSKVDTLRYAIEYIKQLREAVGLEDNGGTSEGFSSPLDMSSESSPSYCATPSPMLMMSASPPMFQDDDDDFLDIDWTTL